MNKTKKIIVGELRHHIPFTFFGAVTGIVIMLLSLNMPYKTAHNIFYVLHPVHIFLSALVTASMYKNYQEKNNKKLQNLLGLIIIGFVGSIGIATLSDSVLPYLGEILLKMPKAEPHIGFIEEWPKITFLAALGILIAYLRPTTKFPHAGHVLISTWASLFHMIMALGGAISAGILLAAFFFLFLAVWIPCCISDIVFPLLFVKKRSHI